MTDLVPDLGLFWIMDTLTGGRKLLDMAEFEIVRAPQCDGLISSENGQVRHTTTVHMMFTDTARSSTTDVNGSEYSVGYEIL